MPLNPIKSAKPRPSSPAQPIADEGATVRLVEVGNGSRKPGFTLYREVVVPVEGSDREYFAQQHAAALAGALGLRVRALHVSPPGGAPSGDLFSYLEAECRRWNVPFEGVVLESGDPSAEIAQEVGPRDLLIVGTRRLATREVLGSFARELLKRVQGPLVLVRLPS